VNNLNVEKCKEKNDRSKNYTKKQTKGGNKEWFEYVIRRENKLRLLRLVNR
jgi:hypothetical protein